MRERGEMGRKSDLGPGGGIYSIERRYTEVNERFCTHSMCAVVVSSSPICHSSHESDESFSAHRHDTGALISGGLLFPLLLFTNSGELIMLGCPVAFESNGTARLNLLFLLNTEKRV